MKPYYEHGGITIYHGDCREIAAWHGADVLVTDPPFGISYQSRAQREVLPSSIANDCDTDVRDTALRMWHLVNRQDRPALVFGSWKAPRPYGTRMLLVWDTLGALGMGDLSLPWKPSHQEIYVLGSGFLGTRDSDVIAYPPVQSMARNGRTHPHEKPVGLLVKLLQKCPCGVVADPFCGTGSTLIAAKQHGLAAIGVELEESYCEIAARRLAQEVMNFDEVDA